MTEHYRVEGNGEGCHSCKHGQNYEIVSGTGDKEFSHWNVDDEGMAREISQLMNEAYGEGRSSVQPKWKSFEEVLPPADGLKIWLWLESDEQPRLVPGSGFTTKSEGRWAAYTPHVFDRPYFSDDIPF